MTAYTAEDYEREIAALKRTRVEFPNLSPGTLAAIALRQQIVLSALRTASLVYKEGVIEAAVGNNRITAERIRKAVGADNG